MSFPVYLLSESESESGKEDEDEDRFLLGIASTSSKPKKSPVEKTSPTKNKPAKKNKPEKSKLQEDKLEKLEMKRKMQEEKQRLLEEKQRLKAERKKVSEKLKQLKPGECMKFISVFIDSSLLNKKFGGELLTALQSAEIVYTVQEQDVPGTISWVRNVEEDLENVHNHMVVIWMWEELVTLISSNTLSSTVKEFVARHSTDRITIVIFGIEEYFRKRKNLQNRELKAGVSNDQTSTKRKKDNLLENIPVLSRIDVEMALGELQLLLNVQYRFVESGEDLGLFIAQLTKALAELPYKLQRNKNQESTDWYASADSRECVRVDSNGHGLLRLWQQQICQFPNVGLDVAQAIVSEYKSPRALMEAYDKCTARKDAELLLQNIPIRRAQGPLTSVRRVGPELSKKIYAFFNSTDGNLLLSQET